MHFKTLVALRVRVLVVEDNDDQRDLLRRLFELADCEVIAAESAEAAIRLYETGDFAFDLAVIDLMLPGMDGWTLSERLQAEHPACPVVISSALDPSEYPKAWAAMPKPISLAGVRAVLSKSVPRWSSQERQKSDGQHEVVQRALSATISLSRNSRLSAAFRKFVSKPSAPWLRQLPTLALYLSAIALILVSPAVTVTNEAAVLGGGLLLVIATIVAVVLSLKVTRWRLAAIVPAIDLIAVFGLQFGTDSTQSVFASFAFLLLAWLCVEARVKHVRLGWLVIALTVSYAFFVLLAIPTNMSRASEYLKGPFDVVVFLFIVGAIAGTLLRETQARVEKSDLLVAQVQRQLAESRLHAKEMAESQALVREADRLIRQLWEASTHQCSIGTDATGWIDAWNPGAVRMLGLTSGQTVGIRRMVDFLLPAELAARSLQLTDQLGATGPNSSFAALVEPARLGPGGVREWTCVRDDGSQVAVELSVNARTDDDGTTTGYLFVAHDLTKINEAARLKDEFVSLISHELRTPLSSILGYLELIRDDEDEVTMSPQQLAYVGIIERNAQRLLSLVSDLLFTAQVESGKFHLDEHEQTLGPILTASVESARPVADTAGITMRLDIGDDQLVNVDSVRLGQACDNLISNAIKYTPRGGTVTVRLKDDPANAVITVSDTGIGIAANELDQLFSRFFRATTATRNAVPGVGLGLVITRAIAVAHGGKMGVTSEEGVGTNFSMSLPLSVTQ